MTLNEIADQLKAWIWRGKHASTDNFSIEIHSLNKRPYVKLTILTVTNSYGIRGVPKPSDPDDVYLCCEFSARVPDPGETHTRGGDLWDGDFSEEGWNRIMQDILSVELAEAAKATA